MTHPPSRTRARPTWLGRRLVAAVLASAVLAPLAAAQDRGVPGGTYFAAVEQMYRGDYRRAQRAFNNELRGAVKTVTTRWIDSAIFHAMLGETLYRQGRNAEALEQFDLACRQFLANTGVFRRAQFPPLRPEANRARRQAPWGPSTRQVTRAQLPPTVLVQFGQVSNQRQYEQGGLVQSAQFWRLNMAEVVRTVALAIRRRTELLGPLSPHDALSRELDDRLSRGGIARTGSWSSGWIDLLTGLAKLGVDKPKEAANYLGRAALLEGRYDHPLTGAALLAQGELMLAAGESAAAAGLLTEAGLAAFVYEDFDVVGRSLWAGHVNHVAAGAAGPHPLLDAATRWADFENYDPLSLRLRQAMAESLTAAGEPDRALALLGARVRSRDLNTGPLAARKRFLAAQALYAQGQLDEAGDALDQAFAQQAALSPRVFQTQAANARFDSGALSARVAVQVYDRLLSDPTPADWARDPHDTLTHLRTNTEGAFGRWFASLIGRREHDKAVAAADLAKRRRFFAALPMGGRLVALRRLIDGVPGDPALAEEEQVVRQAWLRAHPRYAEVARQSRRLRAELADAGPLADGGRFRGEVKPFYDRLAGASLERERLLRAMAFDRRSAPHRFPPTATVEQAQARLKPGDALLVFHQAMDSMSGFLIVKGGLHHWRLPNLAKTEAAVAACLRDLGATSRQATLDAETASTADDAGSRWRAAASQLGATLLADSRLDLDKTERLIVVPDGPLWHAPFEALIAPGSNGRPLVDVAPIRVAPTLGLAAPSSVPLRPLRRSAVVAAKPAKSDRDGEAEAAIERLAAAAGTGGAEAERLLAPWAPSATQVAASLDLMVVTLDSQIEPGDPYSWRPAPAARGAGSLAQWTRLGGEAPQRLVLGATRTAAENALKAGRRSRRAENPAPVGRELFHASCGLLASGVRTALVSRWSTEGLTHQNLLREFTAEAPHVSAPEAWRRSVALARESRLDPTQEPRLKLELDDEPPLASHPFFWSGFLLVDTSLDPLDAAQADDDEAATP